MNDLLLIGTILFAWIALNRWILPAMGIQTCMSGGCCGDSCRTAVEREAVTPTESEADTAETDAVQFAVNLEHSHAQ